MARTPSNLPDRDGPAAPKSCPFCQSPKVGTTGRASAASYYRCDACGQVWHPERFSTARNDGYRRR